jgi:hypothetical protein
MSAEGIYFAPMRVPLVNPDTGIITREWYFLFQAMFRRSNTALDNQLEPASSASADEALASIAALQNLSPVQPVVVAPDEQLLEQVAQLRELVADLFTQIQALRQGTAP